MRVRIMTWLPAVAAFAAAAGAAGSASAQCGTGCTPPPPPPPACCEPPPPPTPPPSPPPCCTPGRPPGGGYEEGDIKVIVNVNNSADASANARARAGLNARTMSGFSTGGGGGSAYVSVDQPYPTVISGLNVEGARAAQMIRTPYRASRWMEKRVVIQAVCIDDRQVPHPASQVRPGRDVSGDYDGELFRCLAGTSLMATIAEYDGVISFDRGQTMRCAKGEALYYNRRGSRGYQAASYSVSESYREGGSVSYGGHASGGYAASGSSSYASSESQSSGSYEEFHDSGWSFDGSGLECRSQKQERDCNERSLLRRYGAGVKILSLYREEYYTAYREEMVETAGSVVTGAVITLDGGVGGRVF